MFSIEIYIHYPDLFYDIITLPLTAIQSVPMVSFLLSVIQHNWFQVSDGQGKTDSKSTKITVLPDPDYLNVVEVVLNKNISHFFQKQVSSPWPGPQHYCI